MPVMDPFRTPSPRDSRADSSPGRPVAPPRAGSALGILLLGLVLCSGCGADGGAAAGSGAGRGNGGPGRPGGGEGKPSGPPVAVAVQEAVIGSISAYYRATASLEVENEAVIEARVSGTVREVRAEEGDEVQAGQIVLRIDPREYQLRAQQAEALADKERNRFERAKKMFEQNLVSEQEFSTARSDLAAAEATLELSELELSYTNVTAPFGGQVVRRTTDIGRTIGPGDPLFALADVHPLLARVHVPAKEFRSLRTDQKVDLLLDSNATMLKGRISLISPIIDPNTGTIKLTVEIDDYPPGTRPGDFAEVQIVTERRDEVLLIPKIAVVSEKGERFVYTPSDSTAVRRVVEVGFEDEESAQILRGLDVGERVVIQGQRSLKDGAPIRILEAMTFEDEPNGTEEAAAS